MADTDVNHPELYDISDVKFHIRQTKLRRQVVLVADASESDFNLFKYYLALKAYIAEMEREIGILADAKGEH